MSKPLPMTVSAALVRILRVLDKLSAEDRGRVLAAVAALGEGST